MSRRVQSEGTRYSRASEARQSTSIGSTASRSGKDCRGPALLFWKNASKMRFVLFDDGAASKDAPMGQRQICSGGSTGQGVIRRMNSARARAQGTEAGQPPDKQSRIAQSIGYVCARAGIGSEEPVTVKATASEGRIFVSIWRMLRSLRDRSSAYIR